MDTESPSTISEALERAVALHAEVLRQVQALLNDEELTLTEEDFEQEPG